MYEDYQYLEKKLEAIEAAKKVCDLNPKDSQTWRDWAAALLLIVGFAENNEENIQYLKDAIKKLEKAVEVNEGDLDARWELGEAIMLSPSVDPKYTAYPDLFTECCFKALDCFIRVRKINPKFRQESRMPDLALKSLDRLKHLAPASPELPEAEFTELDEMPEEVDETPEEVDTTETSSNWEKFSSFYWEHDYYQKKLMELVHPTKESPEVEVTELDEMSEEVDETETSSSGKKAQKLHDAKQRGKVAIQREKAAIQMANETSVLARAREDEILIMADEKSQLHNTLSQRTRELEDIQRMFEQMTIERNEARELLASERQRFMREKAESSIVEASQMAALVDFTRSSMVVANGVASSYYAKGRRGDAYSPPYPNISGVSGLSSPTLPGPSCFVPYASDSAVLDLAVQSPTVPCSACQGRS